MATTQKRETHDERVARMRAEHVAKVAAVKAAHSKRLQAHQQTVTESVTEISTSASADHRIGEIHTTRNPMPGLRHSSSPRMRLAEYA
jgi:hypothetical protein